MPLPQDGSRSLSWLANQPSTPRDKEGGEAAAEDDNEDCWRNLIMKEQCTTLVAECCKSRLRTTNKVAATGFDMAKKMNPMHRMNTAS